MHSSVLLETIKKFLFLVLVNHNHCCDCLLYSLYSIRLNLVQMYNAKIPNYMQYALTEEDINIYIYSTVICSVKGFRDARKM